MLVVEIEGVELDHCLGCEGLWFDATEIAALFARSGGAEAVRGLEAMLDALPSREAGRRLSCPRCRRRLAEIEVPARPAALRLDRCPAGDGLWFDRGELPTLLSGSLPEDAPGLRTVREQLGRFARKKEA